MSQLFLMCLGARPNIETWVTRNMTAWYNIYFALQGSSTVGDWTINPFKKPGNNAALCYVRWVSCLICLSFLNRLTSQHTNLHVRKTWLLDTMISSSKQGYEKYSHLSANGHSRKRTLSRKGTQTLSKMKIGFFFCWRSLVSGHPIIIIDSWQWNLSLICNKSTKYIALWQSNRTVGISFVKSPFFCGKFAIFGYPTKCN